VKEKRRLKLNCNLREELMTMLELMDLTMMILTGVLAMTMFLMRTEMMTEAKKLGMMTMLLARLVMVTMVMVTTEMTVLTILGTWTALKLLSLLTEEVTL
jgi:hypothetical protein